MRLIKLWDADLKKAYELQGAFAANENGYINTAFGLSFEEFQTYVKTREGYSRGIDLPEGHVPDSVYILEDNGVYTGIFNLRHCLNDALREGAGHIGYGVSPAYRGHGYATEGLRLLLEEARHIIPEDEIYLSVSKDNLPSLKVQQKNGAYIHHEDDKKYYTRVKVPVPADASDGNRRA